MVIFESNLSARAFNQEIEMPLLSQLGKAMLVVLAIYGALRFQDLASRGALRLLREPSTESLLLILEVAIGTAVPVVMLAFRSVRENREGLFAAAVFVITGFLLNRLNVSITGLEASSGAHYFPKWTEVSVTLSLVGAGFLFFALAVRYFKVFGSHPLPAGARN
jgi:Ni/Fe-hydrogenase subunit HybB-like protein